MQRGKVPSQSGRYSLETEAGRCTTSVKGMIVSVCSYERYTFPLTVFPGTAHTCWLEASCPNAGGPPLGDELHVIIDEMQ
jgi:hypothetical protein